MMTEFDFSFLPSYFSIIFLAKGKISKSVSLFLSHIGPKRYWPTDCTISSQMYPDMIFSRWTAEFRRFFLGKFLLLLAINHNPSEWRDICVPWLLKLSHVLVVLQLAWVRTFLRLSWITRSVLARFLWRQGSCDGKTDLVVSFNIRQGLKCQHVASTPNLPMWLLHSNCALPWTTK